MVPYDTSVCLSVLCMYSVCRLQPYWSTQQASESWNPPTHLGQPDFKKNWKSPPHLRQKASEDWEPPPTIFKKRQQILNYPTYSDS